MKTLTDLKNQHARNHNYSDWEDLRESVQDDTEYEQHWHAVCVRAQEHALRNAAGNAKITKIGNSGSFYDASVDKNSITKKQNLVQ